MHRLCKWLKTISHCLFLITSFNAIDSLSGGGVGEATISTLEGPNKMTKCVKLCTHSHRPPFGCGLWQQFKNPNVDHPCACYFETKEISLNPGLNPPSPISTGHVMLWVDWLNMNIIDSIPIFEHLFNFHK